MAALGFFSVRLPVSTNFGLGGYGVSRFCETEHDPLEANGLAAYDGGACQFLVLTLDTLFVPGHFASELVRRLKAADSDRFGALDDTDVITIASHCHSAPMIDPKKPKLGVFADEYLQDVLEIISNAVLVSAPATNFEELTFHFHEGLCEGSVYRRADNTVQLRKRRPYFFIQSALKPAPKVEIDQKVRVWKVSGCDGARSIVWSWDCHPVAFYDRTASSADYPGAVREMLRRHFGQPSLPVLFLPGFCGDTRPNFSTYKKERSDWIKFPLSSGPFFTSTTQERFNGLNNMISDAVIAALSVPQACSRSGISFKCTEVPIEAIAIVESVQTKNIPICRIRIGPLEFGGIGAEVSNDYRSLLGEESQIGLMFTGCAGETFGYLPTDAQIPKGGYEVSGYTSSFSHLAKYRKSVESSIVRAWRSLSDLTESSDSLTEKKIEHQN